VLLDWRLPPRRGLWTFLSESKGYFSCCSHIIFVLLWRLCWLYYYYSAISIILFLVYVFIISSIFQAPFSQLRVILGPSVTSPEWRLFGRSEIMGLKIQNNFLIPIREMQVGSWVLITLRHSFAHFDQICIVLGFILVNPQWRWFLKRKIVHLQIWNNIWIPIWELYMWS